ncbi:hypothetical protein EJ04DRAFT_578761 [Polyplosphaeria fusca]|uniref:Heterokaryon incompatibility domain-containing protein n=1 Tax=Polyplosphaeria fusca TaxID=682080 RepID=A0A9P4QQI0_9PLEO|nr:hypothetical protein EJ04DRAFT_578761 [Polyplosphaeria fusca]
MDDEQPLLEGNAGTVYNSADLFVPCTTIIPYHLGDLGTNFNNFHVRHGFHKNDHLDLERPLEEVNQLLQSWLYFGVLSVFLGRPASPTDLKFDAKVGLPLSVGARLQQVIHLFNNRVDRTALRVRGPHIDGLFTILHYADWWSEKFEAAVQDRDSALAHSCLAVKILISSLASALLPNADEYEKRIKHLMKHDPQRRKRSGWVSHFEYRSRLMQNVCLIPLRDVAALPSTSSTLLRSRMLENDWCSHQIKQILSSCDYTTCTYLADMKRFIRKSHRRCADAPKCIAGNARMDNYITRHASETCNCPHITAPIDEIVEIIKRGRVPLVGIVESSDGALEIHVRERTAADRYVAISHVWADGLGNPCANSLPDCILRQLHSWLNNLPLAAYDVGITMGGRRFDASRLDYVAPTTWFWMDTLCIPVDDSLAEIRNTAINDMATIYLGSSQVLVLDTELLNISTRVDDTYDATEVLARIAFSMWSRRSWTFQEGGLGAECIFQLANIAVNVTSQWSPSGPRHSSLKGNFSFPSDDDKINQLIYMTLYERVWDMLQRMYEFVPHRKEDNLYHPPFPHPTRSCGSISLLGGATSTKERRHQGERFVRVWNELCNRSTTKSEDIHIILANLLDLDASALMRYPRDKRMAMLLRNIENIPFSIFLLGGKRVNAQQNHFLRWIPSDPGGNFLDDRNYMELSRHGLSVAAHAERTTSLYFSQQHAFDHSITYCVGLKLQLEFTALRYANDTLPPATQHGILVIFLRPDSNENSHSRSRVLRGACFKVRGYSNCTYEGKRTSFKGTQAEILHLMYDCPIRIKATRSSGIIAERPTTKTRHDPPIVEAEVVPDTAHYLVTCNLHDYPKLRRREVSTSTLAAWLVYILLHFALQFFFLALLYIILIIVIDVVRKERIDGWTIAFTVYTWLSFIGLSIFMVIICIALAHHERCMLLQSSSASNSNEPWMSWTKWILKPLLGCLGAFVGGLQGIMHNSKSYREHERQVEADKDTRLVSNPDKRWQWAEEREIPRLVLDTPAPVAAGPSAESAGGQDEEDVEARWDTTAEDVPLLPVSQPSVSRVMDYIAP